MKMQSKESLYHKINVNDLDSETRTIVSVPLVREFPEVFPNDPPGIPPEYDIDFYIDLLPEINPISVHPYHMALAE